MTALAMLVGCLLSSVALAQLPPEAMSIVRLQLPANAEVEQIRAQLRNTTGSDLAAQARTYTAQADQEFQSMTRRLALRKEAAQCYARAGQWREALRACDVLTSEFNLPYAATRGEVLMQLPFPTETRQPDQISPEQFLLLYLDATDGCILEDEYPTAGLLVAKAQSLQAPILSPLERPSANDLKQRIDRLFPIYMGSVEAAKRTLLNDPLNANAHQIIGEFYGIEKLDWEAALPHLALGTNTRLKPLFVRDMNRPKSADEQVQLGKDYLAAMSSDGRFSLFLARRSEYWTGVSKVRPLATDRIRVNSVGTMERETGSLSVQSIRPDSLPLRRVPPDGAALQLTFDHRSVSATDPRPLSVQLGAGRRSQGRRAVIYDQSPRGNHVEGLRTSTPTNSLAGTSWKSDGAPLCLPQRIFGGLSGYTWTGWIRPNFGVPGFLFTETSSANYHRENQSPEISLDGQRFRIHGAPHWFAESQLRSAYYLNARPESEWAFMAVTISPAQRLRVTWNDVSEEVPIAAGRAVMDGATLFGSIDGTIDEFSVYPRALSEAEVTSIYHYGLHGYQLAKFRQQNDTIGPTLYSKPDLAGGPNVTPMPGGTNNNNGNGGNNGNPSPPPVAVAKRPRPTDEEFKEAKKLVKDLYAKEIDKANTAEDRRKIARKMQEVARETNDPPAARYALFFEAATMLTNFDSPDAWDAWNLLSTDFQGSFHDEKANVLDRLIKKAKLPGEYKLLADRYVTLLNEALKEDDYKSADMLASRAETCVKKAGDKVLERMVAQGGKDLAQMRKAFDSAKSARETLATAPDDVPANLLWGKYMAFYRNQWPDGLKLLAKAGDDPVAVLARKDAAGSSATAGQQELGDAWWTESEKLADERAQRSVRGRAVHWYRQALPQLMGLTSAKIAKRVDTYLSDTSPIPTDTPFDALSMIDPTVHSTSADWGRQGAVVGFTPRSGASYNRLMIPVGLHGNYEMQTKLEWLAGYSGDVVMQLPVGERMVEVDYGSSPDMRVGAAAARPKIEQGAADFQRGKIYVLGAKVTVEGENATVLTTINGRPYISWTGPLNQASTIDSVRSAISRSRASNALGGALLQPVITIQGGYSESFAIGALQLEIQSGWAEPILR